MKILHISATDIYGGAGVAAYQLHLNLLNCGIQSKMLVNYKFSDDENVVCINSNKYYRFIKRILPHIENFAKMLTGESIKLDSLKFGSRISYLRKHTNWADIIILHHISGSFITLDQIVKFNKPCIWYMHDMFSMTGGCHYSEGCDNYKYGCGNCKFVKSPSVDDDSVKNSLNKKKFYLKQSNLFVAPSSWLYIESKKSFLLNNQDIEFIPYSINELVYCRKDKEKVRNGLQITTKKTIILFSVNGNLNDKRKGLDLLLSAINNFSTKEREDYFLLIVGSDNGLNFTNSGIEFKNFKRVSDSETMSNIYNAADFLIIPSREDNLPNTVLESLFCGTPVLAFDIGGMPDMITHKVNGYLASPFSIQDFSNGIKFLKENKGNDFSNSGVREKFSGTNQIDNFKKIFSRLIVEK